MKNNILYLSGGPEAKKTFLHSDLLDIDLEGVGDTPWRSAWEKSFGEQQLFNQMVFFPKNRNKKLISLLSNYFLIFWKMKNYSCKYVYIFQYFR